MADKIGTAVPVDGGWKFRCDDRPDQLEVDITPELQAQVGGPLTEGLRLTYQLKYAGPGSPPALKQLKRIAGPTEPEAPKPPDGKPEDDGEPPPEPPEPEEDNDLSLQAPSLPRGPHEPWAFVAPDPGPRPPAFQPGTTQGTEEGFVNPYNFVPLVGRVRRQQPASHERWSGRSGTIRCQLTFHTPFFLPDPERQQKDGKNHETLSLLRDTECRPSTQNPKKTLKKMSSVLQQGAERRPLIPGATLKGVFRNMAEALSNSCLSELDDARLNWRPLPVKENNARYWKYRQVGRVVQLPDPNTGAEGRLQPGLIAKIPLDKVDFKFRDNDPASADGELAARWGGQGGLPTVTARADHGNGEHKGFFKITEVPAEEGKPSQKKSQRFVAEDPDRSSLPFSLEVRRDYDEAHRAGRKLDGDDHESPYTPAYPGSFHGGQRRWRHRLEEGDWVYFIERDGQVDSLGPVELYRVMYHYSIGDGVPQWEQDGQPEGFLRCADPAALCPACRLFGWIPPERREREREQEEARSGFVRFSTARFLGATPPQQAPVTLKPLGAPKPTATSFYLHGMKDAAQERTYDEADFAVRGRKFYWHQPADRETVKDQRGENRQPKQDDQNKTVELLWKDREGRLPQFEFTVEFDNLSDADLGLLLLSLQPNLLGPGNVPSAQLFHHLGMGKPLGLGSAEVTITELTLLDRAARYRGLTETGKTTYRREGQEDSVTPATKEFVDAFIHAALKAQHVTPGSDPARARRQFAAMPHVESLLLLLDWEHQPQGVRYPPGPDEAPEESFRWFMEVNERLLTPREIADGKRQKPFEKRERKGQGGQGDKGTG